MNKFKNNLHIDNLKVILYLGASINDTTLVILRNKKIINEYIGKEAINIYNIITGENKK